MNLYCSIERSANEAVIRKKKSPLIDISNVENNDLYENSLVHNNINYKPNEDISKNGMVINAFLSILSVFCILFRAIMMFFLPTRFILVVISIQSKVLIYEDLRNHQVRYTFNCLLSVYVIFCYL